MKEIKFADFSVKFDDSDEMKTKVFDALIAWYSEHETFSGESIAQSDGPLIDAAPLLESIADDVICFDEDWD